MLKDFEDFHRDTGRDLTAEKVPLALIRVANTMDTVGIKLCTVQRLELKLGQSGRYLTDLIWKSRCIYLVSPTYQKLLLLKLRAEEHLIMRRRVAAKVRVHRN